MCEREAQLRAQEYVGWEIWNLAAAQRLRKIPDVAAATIAGLLKWQAVWGAEPADQGWCLIPSLAASNGGAPARAS